MKREQRIDAFVQLGKYLKNQNEHFNDDLYYEVYVKNRWFSKINVEKSLENIAKMLDETKLHQWISKYSEPTQFKNVGIVMAGNIPAVGFHDLLCVLVSGHRAIIKCSSQDEVLIKKITSILTEIQPQFNPQIHFQERLKNFEVVIATGSNNSSRYFEYYFSKYPHIIRKSRTSIAALDNKMTDEDLRKLGNDIFDFYGLGCRNVSHIFVPQDFNFKRLNDNWSSFKLQLDNTKYLNNYDYNKSIYLVNGVNFLELDFLLLTENNQLNSPIGVLHYQYYDTLEEVEKYLAIHQNNIQCVVSSLSGLKNCVPFGMSQQPELWDYADGIDTMEFLRF